MHQYSAPLKERSSASLGRNFGDSVFLPMCNKRMSATENIKMSQKVGKLRKPAGEKTTGCVILSFYLVRPIYHNHYC